VTRAADEVAAGLPIVLCAEVVVAGEGATELDRAREEAWRLVDAGLTHLAVDVSAVAPGERGRVLGDVAEAPAERGVSIEFVVPAQDGARAGPRAADLVDELARRGIAVDAASVRCPAPEDDGEARLQAAVLARLCQALEGVPVMRRGPVTPAVLELLRGSPVRACEDGGAAAARALALIPPASPRAGAGGGAGALGEGEDEVPSRASRLERAAAELPAEGADRLEARAYVEAVDFVERLGARGSALAVSRALERRLEER
jgi:hypothetical protein